MDYRSLCIKIIKTVVILTLLTIHGVYANDTQLEDLLTSSPMLDFLELHYDDFQTHISTNASLSLLSLNHNLILADIKEIRKITTLVNSQLYKILENYIERNSISLCMRLLLRANQRVLRKLLTTWLDEGLSELQLLMKKTHNKLENIHRNLRKHIRDTLNLYRRCSKNGRETDELIEEVKFDIEECMCEKNQEIEDIYKPVRLKLNELKMTIREYPRQFLTCMSRESTRNDGGLFTCVREMGSEITLASPKALELIDEGRTIDVRLMKTINVIEDCAKTRLELVKLELSAAGLLVAACLYEIRLTFY